MKHKTVSFLKLNFGQRVSKVILDSVSYFFVNNLNAVQIWQWPMQNLQTISSNKKALVKGFGQRRGSTWNLISGSTKMWQMRWHWVTWNDLISVQPYILVALSHFFSGTCDRLSHNLFSFTSERGLSAVSHNWSGQMHLPMHLFRKSCIFVVVKMDGAEPLLPSAIQLLELNVVLQNQQSCLQSTAVAPFSFWKPPLFLAELMVHSCPQMFTAQFIWFAAGGHGTLGSRFADTADFSGLLNH